MCIPFCIPVPDWPNFLESTEFRQFRGAHAGIKSVQGKIYLFRNGKESVILASSRWKFSSEDNGTHGARVLSVLSLVTEKCEMGYL